MDELLEILEELHPDVDFETEEHLIENMILDSFDIVTLIAEIGEVFGVTVTAQYITPQNFNSAKALWALIEKLEEEE
ncbi:MAG: acyl carrier protein [Eubacteriales bacterium]|nr:acyl carrier protein [Eubacteriales bacterium]